MIKLHDKGVFLVDGRKLADEDRASSLSMEVGANPDKVKASKGTISYDILKSHNKSGDVDNLKITFDAMASHDITYVGIIQTAMASGMTKFPLPYVLTNCHNSLCAVGGTINEDDHLFGLSAAEKFGGIYVPAHIGVIHQYMREMHAACGSMILGSDSHTRYGALGCMAIGEGGGELSKQLLKDTYDIKRPEVVLVYMTGSPMPGVGPQDIALAIIGAVFKNGYVKNKIMEFVGPGIASMSADYRNGIDVMTTETTCLSSVWETDEEVERYLTDHGREDDYKRLFPKMVAYYDGCIEINLSEIKPMIALPFHPSNVYEIEEFNRNAEDILYDVEMEADRISGMEGSLKLREKLENGRLRVEQGVIGGCAGGNYTNIIEAANLLKGKTIGNGAFVLDVYPSSQPVFLDTVKKGAVADLMAAGAIVKTAFCGPCFGAGDTPANNTLSIRHNTRNFPNREGSKPGNSQMAGVALMDSRSIAATAANGGLITPATEFDGWGNVPDHEFDMGVYESRVYFGYKKPDKKRELVYGPNIKPWPKMEELADNILLQVCSKIEDEVTTTDELIPSGETSSYRSNPLGLAEFTLSRRDPDYVPRAKETRKLEDMRLANENPGLKDDKLGNAYKVIRTIPGNENVDDERVQIGSMIYANKPGDGSAREQAASCQRVLGGLANITKEYATKRYRSNVINWGMIPFQTKDRVDNINVGDFIYIPKIRDVFNEGNDMSNIPAYIIHDDKFEKIELYIDSLTDIEKEIIKAGSLINYNKQKASA